MGEGRAIFRRYGSRSCALCQPRAPAFCFSFVKAAQGFKFFLLSFLVGLPSTKFIAPPCYAFIQFNIPESGHHRLEAQFCRDVRSMMRHCYCASRRASTGSQIRTFSGLATLAGKPTVPVATSLVEGFMRSTAERRAAELALLGATALSRDALCGMITHSRSGIDAVLAARAVCSLPQYSSQPWARVVDAAALRALQPIYGPRLTTLHQLAFDDSSPEHIRDLASAARSTETVHPITSEASWLLRFGERRMVHALAHVSTPSVLLAAVFSAILPRIPASLSEVDRDSGAGLTSGAGRWNVAGASPLVSSSGEPCRALIFYSISRANPLFRGLGLGRRLIFDVASSLAVRRPDIAYFATLSPVPGFVSWVQAQSIAASPEVCVEPHELEALENVAAMCPGMPGRRKGPGLVALSSLLQSRAWFDNEAARALLRPLLMRLCAQYLHRGLGPPRCPVASFHLRNGATMARVCWAADAENGAVLAGAGMMVNYVYSKTGADGLQDTSAQALRFAKDPAAVLAEQTPAL